MNYAIRETLIMCPIWEEGVWSSIAQRNYNSATEQLTRFLRESFSREDWNEVNWSGIINGIPLFRGESITVSDWNKYILPTVARAVRAVASDEILYDIYSFLDEKDLKKFRA